MALSISPCLVFAEGSSRTGLEPSAARLAGLVNELGHEAWSRREAAQDGLLSRRGEATTLLREALSSNNLELRYRARYLLDMLDPVLGHFQVIKIRLGDAPRVTATGYVSGKSHEELTLQTRDLGPPEGTQSSYRYSIFFATLHGRGLELLVKRSLRGYSTSDTLSTPLTDEAAISLLARTEECHYQQFGVRLERERHRFLTLLRVRHGRASELRGVELAQDPEIILQSVLEELLSQARSPEHATRAAAIEVLGCLGGGELGERFAVAARSVLTAAMADPTLRPLAIFGLDRSEDLDALVRSGPSEPATSQGLPPPRVRAAVRLLERGDTTHLPFLLDRLTEDNPEHLHYIMAGIADFVESRRPSTNEGPRGAPELDGDTRRLLVRRIFGDSFFSHAVWQNRETAYFIDRISSLLDPTAAEDVAILQESLARLEGMVTGATGAVRVSLSVCQPIWQRLARRLPSPPSERAMLFRLLPSMMSGTSVSMVLGAMDEALQDEPLSDPELRTLLDTLLVYRSTSMPSATKLLVQVLRSVQLREGQLRPLLVAALDLAEQYTSSSASTRSTSALFLQIADRLRALTGVSVPGTSRDVGPWKSWLEDDEKVREQEKKLLALQDGGSGAGRSLLVAEFDLIVNTTTTGAERGSGPSEFELVDGRVIVFRDGERIAYTDRWGNQVRRRLREVKQSLRRTLRRPTRKLPEGQPTVKVPLRYRFDDSHLQLTVGVPVLNSMTGRDVSSAWVETAAFFLGSRPLPSGSSSSYRTITLLTEPTPDLPPAESPPSALWSWFLETHILHLPKDAPPSLVSAVARILRTLKIEGARPVLLEIFDRGPTYDLARDLYTLFGERRGIEYYRNQLPDLTGSRRLSAAKMLAEAGESAGVDVLLEDGRGTSLMALDRYLQLPSTPPAERERVLDFLVGRLKFDSIRDEADAKVIFATLRREANDDFGFTTAVGTDDDRVKTANIRKAIEQARKWRQEASSKPRAPSESSR